KASPFTNGFGREERLDNPPHDFRRNAAPRVGHRDSDIVPGRQTPYFVIRQLYVAGTDAQSPPLTHGIAGIGHKVQQSGLKLYRIQHDGMQPLAKVNLEAHLRIAHPAQYILETIDQLVDVYF